MNFIPMFSKEHYEQLPMTCVPFCTTLPLFFDAHTLYAHIKASIAARLDFFITTVQASVYLMASVQMPPIARFLLATCLQATALLYLLHYHVDFVLIFCQKVDGVCNSSYSLFLFHRLCHFSFS